MFILKKYSGLCLFIAAVLFVVSPFVLAAEVAPGEEPAVTLTTPPQPDAKADEDNKAGLGDLAAASLNTERRTVPKADGNTPDVAEVTLGEGAVEEPNESAEPAVEGEPSPRGAPPAADEVIKSVAEGVDNPPETVAPAPDERSLSRAMVPAVAFSLDSEEQRRAYASGVSLGRYVVENLAAQRRLHVTLNKDILLSGIADALNDDSRMSDPELHATMASFDEQMSILTLGMRQREEEAGRHYREEFARIEGVKKHKNGMYYLIEKRGEGPVVKDDSLVSVRYRGALLDKTVFADVGEESETRMRVSSMMPALRDGIKLLKAGGSMKIVATADKAFGATALPAGIAEGATLTFELVLVSIIK